MPLASLMRGTGQRFVYILRSVSEFTRHSVGSTSNVDERLTWHNREFAGCTVHHQPWRVIVSIEFPEEQVHAIPRPSRQSLPVGLVGTAASVTRRTPRRGSRGAARSR